MQVQPLPLVFDPERLRGEVERLQQEYPFHPISNQIALTHRPNALDPFYDGVGSLYDPLTKLPLATEAEFNEFNSQLKNTYLFEIFQTVSQRSHQPIGRVRLMRLLPKSCLSMHIDKGSRLHLPVLTNPQCFLVFRDFGAHHLPADGRLRWVNTSLHHTAINGDGEDPRVHLVFSLCGEEPWTDSQT